MNIISEPEENYKSGWIKLFRSIKNHWIYPKNTPFTQFEAWLTILIEVNHSGEKVRIGNEFYECARGEKLYSLDTWAKLFNWDKSKVRRFLKLLQNDSMIVLKSEQKTTRLIVCNYETYQSERNANETQMKRKRNANETQTTPIKECKELKNEKELKKGEIPTLIPKKKRPQPDALQFPFSGPEFLIAWNKLITLPKWRKKEMLSLQEALNNISKYDEEFAINQLKLAIAGNWQGLTFPDTDEKFLKWKNSKNGKSTNNNSNKEYVRDYTLKE